MEKIKLKSIKTKIMASICLLVTISLVVVGVIVSVRTYTDAIKSLEKTISNTANVSSQLVYEYLSSYEKVVYEIGLTTRFTDPTVSLENKKEMLDYKIKQHNFVDGNIVGKDGDSIFGDVNISDREYFKLAMDGIASTSDVLMSKRLNTYTLIVAAPLWKDGIADSTVEGAVYFNINVKDLSTITNQIKAGDSGSAYMIDSNGFTIAHQSEDLVNNRYNAIEEAKTDKASIELADIQGDMINGTSGFDIYSFDGEKKLMGYAPINTDVGWSIAVVADLTEFMSATYFTMFIQVIIIIIAMIAGVILSVWLANSITKPIIEIKNVAEQMALGNYDRDLGYKSNNEIGQLADSIRQMMYVTNDVIKDTSRGLREISNGNFDVAPTAEYIGIFKEIKNAMAKIIIDLSSFINQIKISSEEVYSGSSQVSDSAQSLAQGAAEQAGTIQELSEFINEILKQINYNSSDSEKASKLTISSSDQLVSSNNQMQSMIMAMSKISESSNEIGRIIKTIDDIAFQTNILALNAAVEAARAGVAGKGFAVVADEVRNLAGKSAEAAKQTSSLIQESINLVGEGVNIANNTAISLGAVVEESIEIKELMKKIAKASLEQSESIERINTNVEHITSVVHTNSATSEESAATSEELSGQANMMNNLISKFKLLQSENKNQIK